MLPCILGFDKLGPLSVDVKLKQIEIENFRAIARLSLPLEDDVTVLYGKNADGKTSVLRAVAVGLGGIPQLLPGVSGIAFGSGDLRGRGPMRIQITTRQGLSWSRQRFAGGRRTATRKELQNYISTIVDADREGTPPLDLPIVAYYDTDRAVFEVPQRRSRRRKSFPRYAALDGALTARSNFREFFNWFYDKEFEELRLRRDDWQSGQLSLKELDTVRSAIELMIPGASNPRIAFRPSRFVVSMDFESSGTETLSMNEMSGGYRTLLALAADLARRMAIGNPHLKDPLSSEAIVLIDEVELHLHPEWQQRVLSDLTRTFPNTQFIVSTHSPQVLTTIRPNQIIGLRRMPFGVEAVRPSGPTFGAEAGKVLQGVMGVRERPQGVEFVTLLDKYEKQISKGAGESDCAKRLREKLVELSARDAGLDRADIEIRRQRIIQNMEQSE